MQLENARVHDEPRQPAAPLGHLARPKVPSKISCLAERTSKSHSDSLGDAQRLPNGNTIAVLSNDGLIEEVDSSWSVVQTLEASSFGYADWRETLYGPPPR